MAEQSWLLTRWLCLWVPWREGGRAGYQPRRCVSEAAEPQLAALAPAIPPRWGRGCSGPPAAHTHSRQSSGLVAFLWQGHEAGWRASGVPSNHLPPPGLCTMKIIPYSYTWHANIQFFSCLVRTQFSTKSQIEKFFKRTPPLRSSKLLPLRHKTLKLVTPVYLFMTKLLACTLLCSFPLLTQTLFFSSNNNSVGSISIVLEVVL